MNIYDQCNEDFDNFITKMKSQKLIEGSMDFNSISEDEAVTISKTIWMDILHKMSKDNDNDDFEHLKYFLHELEQRCSGFSYIFAYGNNNKVNGLVWMTATMRDNFKRFGSLKSLDDLNFSKSCCNM